MLPTPSSVSHGPSQITITWTNGQTSSYHNIWLRDACQCPQHFHAVTKQRLQNTFDIPEDVHASNVKISGSGISVTWQYDNHVSIFESDWLIRHSYNPCLVKDRAPKGCSIELNAKLPRKLWDPSDFKRDLPTVDYHKVMASSNEGVAEWTKKIWQFGCCFVENVPVSPQATQTLVERLDYIRHTHYGGFWDFTSDLAKNDLAYTDVYLACHTDGTYWTDTPGLQLFHLLEHDGEGGESMLTDGFAAARALKENYPEHYETLSRIRIPAHSAGEESVCIEPIAPMPVFTHHPVTGELIQVRWNNDDRSIMDDWQCPDDVVKFYSAIRVWRKILEEREFVIQLVPGTCLIFDNWRVLHGRMAFKGKRRMCGAYVNMDDFISKTRIFNFSKPSVLESL